MDKPNGTPVIKDQKICDTRKRKTHAKKDRKTAENQHDGSINAKCTDAWTSQATEWRRTCWSWSSSGITVALDLRSRRGLSKKKADCVRFFMGRAAWEARQSSETKRSGSRNAWVDPARYRNMDSMTGAPAKRVGNKPGRVVRSEFDPIDSGSD